MSLILVYGMEGCGPSIMAYEMIKKAGLEVEFINIEHEPQRAWDAGIRATPTFDVEDCERIIGFKRSTLKKLKRLSTTET